MISNRFSRVGRAVWRSLQAACVSVFGALVMNVACAEVVIATLTDGPGAREFISQQALREEILSLTAGEFDVRFPVEQRVTGDWTPAGIQASLKALLADSDVDIVVCLGALSSQAAARESNLPKPVLATLVLDAELQGFPLTNGVSGRRNLVYITNVRSLDQDLAEFRAAVSFTRVVALVDAGVLSGFETFGKAKAVQLRDQLGIELIPVPVQASPAAAIKQLPEGTEAVYVTPLLRFADDGISGLAAALVERRLPSFSALGIEEVVDGLLLASGGRPEDDVRVIRRIALDVQRILLGDAPADIPVALQESRRIAINLRTAKAIGFAPRFALLAEAEQLFADALETGAPLTLLQAMSRAVDANLLLKVAEADPLLAQVEVRQSRSALLPQVQLRARSTRIDEDRTLPGFQPEGSTDVEAVGSQLIYSDDAWAALRVSEYLSRASDAEFAIAVLDVLQGTGLAYLDLLRREAFEKVQRSNLDVTRTNLELARVRESIGFSGRADLLRWESEIATAQRQLVEATAERRKAEDRLLQFLNLPQVESVKVLDDSVSSVLAMFSQPRFLALIDNALTWETFQSFVVERGLSTSPELTRVEQGVLAGERQLTAAKRRFFVPRFALEGFAGRNLDRSGAGSNFAAAGIDDDSWQVGLQASLPVFNGGALRADLSRQRYSLRQSRDRLDFVAQDVETRIRVALEQVASSYSAIELTEEAARAATENLRIISDAYVKGARSVTDLVDAQNNALFADLSAAQANYVYLGDVINVLRESGDFSLLLDAQYINEWFRDVENFFAERGVSLDY